MISTILETIKQSYTGYFNYILQEITNPKFENYFYDIIIISIAVFGLELIRPWRKNQKVFRKDFFLDLFYMFFNFYLFNLIVFIAFSNTVELLFKELLGTVGLEISDLQLFDVDEFGVPLSLLVFFLITDFIQWCTHVILHRVPFLWNFHKVHHSVKEMGFAAHLRYHWMETLVYRTMLYLPLAFIGGFEVEEVVLVHFFTIVIGHLNHANFKIPLGPFKYLFNSAEMHIWHHAKDLPPSHKHGMNFGISLSIWDYIFRTNYIPHSGRDLELGFDNDEDFPKDFIHQEMYPLGKSTETKK